MNDEFQPPYFRIDARIKIDDESEWEPTEVFTANMSRDAAIFYAGYSDENACYEAEFLDCTEVTVTDYKKGIEYEGPSCC